MTEAKNNPFEKAQKRDFVRIATGHRRYIADLINDILARMKETDVLGTLQVGTIVLGSTAHFMNSLLGALNSTHEGLESWDKSKEQLLEYLSGMLDGIQPKYNKDELN